MSQFQQLDQLMERQDGMLRTGQALAAGILAHAFEDQPHALFDFRSIHNRLSAVIQREASYHERSFRCGTRHRDSR